MVVPDDRSGDVVHCPQCDRELDIPVVAAPLPPPPLPADADDHLPLPVVVDPLVAAPVHVPGDRDRRLACAIGWSLTVLALLNAAPAATVLFRPPGSGVAGLEPWAAGILLLGILQLCYAFYLLQVPDWSSARVVSFVTLAIAALYALAAGMRSLASPGHRVMELLALDDNRFSTRQETLWCFAMALLTGTLSYLAGRVSNQWARRARQTHDERSAATGQRTER